MNYKLIKTCFLICGLLVSSNAWGEKMIFKSDFRDEINGWQKQGQAVLSPVTRTPGGRSLKIWRNNEEDDSIQTSWTSPLIKIDGKAVMVSFWAADNYLIQQDFSYSAVVAIEKCNAKGIITGRLKDIYIEWDNELKFHYFWGKRLSDALVWKYYTYIVPARINQFKLKFTWPKQLVRGTCYLTDVMASSVTESETQNEKQSIQAKESPYKLLLSSPAPGNLFYSTDELRFDALIFAPDQKSIKLPKGAVIKYQIRDLEKSSITENSIPLLPSNPVKDKSFYSSHAAKKRNVTPDNNLVKRLVIKDKKAKETGREFFIKVSLVQNGQVLAEDTVPYGIVEYFDYNGLDLSKSHFYNWTQGLNFYDTTSKSRHDVTDQNIPRKMRSVRNCMFKYDWRKNQPAYPGPINVKKEYPGFPKMTYMPNIEQATYEKFVPEGAQKKKGGINHRGYRLVDYNVEAYVKYIVEFIRVNQDGIDWVIPSGLERIITERAADLQKKAYAAIKKNFPELKVGCMVRNGDFENFKKHKLYDYTDFIDDHLYMSRFNFDTFKEVKTFYTTTLKRPCPPFVSTECARISDNTQLNQASALMTGIWELMENGISAILYYNMCNRKPLDNPDIENEISRMGGHAGYRFVQLVDRPVMAPEIAMAPGYEKYRWYDRSAVGAGLSIMPTLKTMTYYDLVKDFDWTEFRRSLRVGKSKVFIFDTQNSTRCGLETISDFTPETLTVESDVPYTFKDMFGRTYKITPIHGKSIIQLPEYPVTLIFERKVSSLDFKLCSGGLEESQSYSGALELKLDIPCLDMKGKLEAQLNVFGPNAIRNSCKVRETGKRLTVQKKIKIPDNAEKGDFQMNVLLKKEDSVFGIFRNRLTISSPLSVVLTPCPITDGSEPGVSVKLENFSGKTLSGRVLFCNKYLTTKMRPENVEKKFSIKAKEKKTIFFNVAAELATQNFNEKIDVKVQLAGGKEIIKQAKLFFRVCPYADRPVKINGDLRDWPLDKLHPVKMERLKMRDANIPCADSAESIAEFYTMWREDVLYMAIIVKDKTPQSRSMDVNLWKDDNVLLGLYPWQHKTGEALKKGYFREHIGLMEDGKVGKFRLESPAGAQSDMKDVQTAIKRTEDGYIYEFAYPAKSLFPLKINSGSGFRLSLTVFDADTRGECVANRFNGQLSFFGGANANWTANPALWYEFIFSK